MSFRTKLEPGAIKARNPLKLSGLLCKTAKAVSTPLGMTKGLTAALFVGLISLCAAFGQEAPSTTPTPPAPSPNLSPTRSVRISFVPPPLEGTISLGIYDSNSKLVRILHQEAELNEFAIGADALVTQWDGQKDDGEDLPAGKYHARGYLVGHFKVEDLGKTSQPEGNAAGTVQIKLMPNPLTKDAKLIVDLAVGFDDENSYLKTVDGLPLFTIAQTPNVVRASLTKTGEKSIDVFQDV